jgi:hypothetical protein
MKFKILAFIMCLAPASLFAQQAAYTNIFPQFVDGQIKGNSYRSFLFINNHSGFSADCVLYLVGVDANRIMGSTAFTLPTNTVTARQTAGTAAMQSGYARLDCSSPVFASLVYMQGNPVDGMATVFSSTSAKSYAVVQLLTGTNVHYAIALANDTDATADVLLTFQPSSTNQTSGERIHIPPRSHYVNFLDQIINAPPGAGLLLINGEGGSVFHLTTLLYVGSVFTTVIPFTN